MTIIGKAKELQKLHGSEYAINFFKNKITEIGPILNFEDACSQSGYETAIDWLVKGDAKMTEDVREFLRTLKK